jgi:Tol biopolymer transport system component
MIEIGLFPEWSPVADSLVYQKARERGGRWFSIWRVDLQMGEPGYPVELASSHEMALIQPSWSPDGQGITYGTARLGQGGHPISDADATMTHGDIWIMQADGSTPAQLTDGSGTHFGSVWGEDGRVYFTSRITGSENIWSVLPAAAPMPQDPTAKEITPESAETLGAIISEDTVRSGG